MNQLQQRQGTDLIPLHVTSPIDDGCLMPLHAAPQPERGRNRITSLHKNVPILMYHSISHSTNPKFAQFAVPPAQFAEQMAYLHDHGYTPLTVTELVTRSVERLPEKPVVLTFDDGMADFFTKALPVLTRYNFAATLYIVTSFVGGSCSWLQREGEAGRAMMTWKQIVLAQLAGIECAAHSHTHPQLDTLPPAQAQHEIRISKRFLEEHLGQSVTSFAYPYGYYTPETQRVVQEAGYTSACAVKHAMHTAATQPFALPRLMVKPTTTLEDFADLLSGKSTLSSALFTAYARMRTPVWQIVRRNISPIFVQ